MPTLQRGLVDAACLEKDVEEGSSVKVDVTRAKSVVACLWCLPVVLSSLDLACLQQPTTGNGSHPHQLKCTVTTIIAPLTLQQETLWALFFSSQWWHVGTV